MESGVGVNLKQYSKIYLAFDQAVISDSPFGTVIHTASPYHFNATDVKKDLLDPGIVALAWKLWIRSNV